MAPNWPGSIQRVVDVHGVFAWQVFSYVHPVCCSTNSCFEEIGEWEGHVAVRIRPGYIL